MVLPKTDISYLILRVNEIKKDAKLLEYNSNGRKVLVNKMRPSTEFYAFESEWSVVSNGKTPVFETGEGGIEISTFTEKSKQDLHKHLIGTEIYTVIEGTMRLQLEERYTVTLNVCDEIIVFPGTAHRILNDEQNEHFLVRVHSINCYGKEDKYLKINNNWQIIKTQHKI
ncbi:MAG: hypothetical protein L3V56_07460 [Candidatus Magnetoovum sp. WYHC-5]|nr:hypothetical protein [Candidatus Magnetoovum sp. WYHC-5]